MVSVLKTAIVLVLAGLAASSPLAPAVAQHRSRSEQRKADKSPVVLPPPSSAPPRAAPSDTRPYDAQLVRLAGILGTLTYMRNLCGYADADAWRARMEALLQAEGEPAVRKERLAGAFNRGFRDYGMFYRRCTPNAHLVIERFLGESERIAKDVENRYRAS